MVSTVRTSQLNILVVEDNSINITFIKSLFSDYNIKSDVAENGRVAVEKLKRWQYDIVLMDIEMPDMNGYEATEAIRNDLKNNVHGSFKLNTEKYMQHQLNNPFMINTEELQKPSHW